MDRGQVRWYRFPHPNNRRPVLVLTRGSALRFLNEATVAPVTTTIRGIPTEVRLGINDGMPRDCAVNLDHVQTVSRAQLGPLITSLGSHHMDEVRTALLFALGFDGLD
ncbi:MAG: type II toxin-antitoxin system PemK/MazF family toxin [Thermoanaerobaculia bacterium]|nr:type II toxin-antitoxin system PemK/MazF family toxin [Thermoanaerobaculia bacterium]